MKLDKDNAAFLKNFAIKQNLADEYQRRNKQCPFNS